MCLDFLTLRNVRRFCDHGEQLAAACPQFGGCVCSQQHCKYGKRVQLCFLLEFTILPLRLAVAVPCKRHSWCICYISIYHFTNSSGVCVKGGFPCTPNAFLGDKSGSQHTDVVCVHLFYRLLSPVRRAWVLYGVSQMKYLIPV